MVQKPPFEITEKMLNLVSRISEKLALLNLDFLESSPRLRKENRIKTISGTLAIEGNTLTLDQVTAIFEGKRVLGSAREIAEVKGALELYDLLSTFNPFSMDDFLKAHKIMMGELLTDAGRFRKKSVGIHKGKEIVHVAPPAKKVSSLMENLFKWLENTEINPLISSSVFHYELEFVHPFMDGNGRMGRFWQTLILSKWKKIFAFLPLENIIREEQKDYYQVLEKSDEAASSTLFIEFMLEAIFKTVTETTTGQVTGQATGQVEALMTVMDRHWISARDIMEKLGLSHRQTFRENYLNPALKLGLIEMSHPEAPRHPKQKYRKR